MVAGMLYSVQVLIAMIVAYFVGSILTGVWIGKRYRGVDIRAYGSGNAGATNAMRVIGVKLGVLVLLLDVLKGFLPVLLLPLVLGIEPVTPTVQLLIGASAVAGHMFSWMAGFKGGKGVATGLGVFLAVAPKVMLIVLLIALIVIGFSGYVSLVAVAASVVIPYLLWWYEYPWPVIAVAAVVCAFIIIRHESNILRLIAGRESRIWDPAGPDKKGGDEVVASEVEEDPADRSAKA